MLCYIVTNTISGEIMGANNYLALARVVDDLGENRHLTEETQSELRSVEMLANVASSFDVPVRRSIIEPQWHRTHDAFRDAANRGDLAACYIIQDLMTESMAMILYSFLSGRRE